MESQRSTPEQKLLKFFAARTKPWYEAADRAEIRNEPVLATFYRNTAWRIEHGCEWLDDVNLKLYLRHEIDEIKLDYIMEYGELGEVTIL
jgi:hypothetical protein